MVTIVGILRTLKVSASMAFEYPVPSCLGYSIGSAADLGTAGQKSIELV